MSVNAVLCVAASALAVVAMSAAAHADPPCARFKVCQYQPNRWYNGPLMLPGQPADGVRPHRLPLLSGGARQRLLRRPLKCPTSTHGEAVGTACSRC